MIGAISDDFTGATDVALAFRARGLRTRLYFGPPPDTAALHPVDSADAIVVALKSRMAPHREAVAQSLSTLNWLLAQGADRIYFKYCSTFDSTPDGNIGPVLDALADALGVSTVITTPSSPGHRRTQYQGYLFVDDLLLSDSHMATHPVNPMTESSLRKLLGAQTKHSVGLIAWDAVRAGPAAVRARAAEQAANGHRYLFVDAVDEPDLLTIGEAVLDDRLIAGAAGLAGALAAAVRASRPGGRAHDADVRALPETVVRGPIAILSGSCSVRTLRQIAELVERDHPLYQLDPLRDSDPITMSGNAVAWYDSIRARKPTGSSVLVLARRGRARTCTRKIGRHPAGRAPRSGIRAHRRRSARSRIHPDHHRRWRNGRRGRHRIGSGRWPARARGRRRRAVGLNAEEDLALLLKSGNFGPPELLADLAAEAAP